MIPSINAIIREMAGCGLTGVAGLVRGEGEITIFCRNYFVMRAYRRMNSFSLLILFRRGYAMVRTHLLALLLLSSLSLVSRRCVAAGGWPPRKAGISAATKAAATNAASANAVDGPGYTVDGLLKYPADYREWVYLTSGLDMSYATNAQPAGHSMFDNVFVNPAAYKVFVKTGTWPEGTMLIIE